MTISLCQTFRGKDFKRLLSCLMVMVYLLVVQYTLSHVHTAPDESRQSEITWQNPAASITDDNNDNQNPDNHHSSVCMLVSQASSPAHFFKTKVLFGVVYNDRLYLLSIDSPTPTKRQTRAPPSHNA